MGFTLLDLLMLLLIVIFAIAGYKRGAIRAVISAIAMLIAALMTTVLSNPIAQAIYNGGVKQTIVSKIESAEKLTKQEGGTIYKNLVDILPSVVGKSLNAFGLTSDSITSASNHGTEQVEKLIAPIMVSFISVITAAVLFAVLMAVAKIVCTMIYRSLSDDLLSTLDSIGGAAIGIVESLIIVFVAAFILRIAVPHMDNPPDIISEKTISESSIFKGIYNTPVLTEFVSAVTDSPNTAALD